jgi:hypothetical protein
VILGLTGVEHLSHGLAPSNDGNRGNRCHRYPDIRHYPLLKGYLLVCGPFGQYYKGKYFKGGNTMAKDRKPAEEWSGPAEQTMVQARTAVDTYFDYLKKAISSTPSGGTELGEKLKSYAEKNVSTTHEFVKQLSQAKDFQEMARIQTEFMQSMVNAFGEQTRSLAEAYTKAASDVVKKPLTGMS